MLYQRNSHSCFYQKGIDSILFYSYKYLVSPQEEKWQTRQRFQAAWQCCYTCWKSTGGVKSMLFRRKFSNFEWMKGVLERLKRGIYNERFNHKSCSWIGGIHVIRTSCVLKYEHCWRFPSWKWKCLAKCDILTCFFNTGETWKTFRHIYVHWIFSDFLQG